MGQTERRERWRDEGGRDEGQISYMLDEDNEERLTKERRWDSAYSSVDSLLSS